MSTVIAFPAARSGRARAALPAGGAQIVILPVVRIERHIEPHMGICAGPAAQVTVLPRLSMGPVFSGGGRRAR